MRLSYTGIGPARIGMTEAQLRKVLAGPFQVNDQAADDSVQCYYLELRAGGVGFMFLDYKLARIDVYETPWRTVSGAGVGTTEAEIHRLYGHVEDQPHHYDSEGKYLFVTPDNPALRQYDLVFETDGKVVTAFRAGLRKATAYVEGCA